MKANRPFFYDPNHVGLEELTSYEQYKGLCFILKMGGEEERRGEERRGEERREETPISVMSEGGWSFLNFERYKRGQNMRMRWPFRGKKKRRNFRRCSDQGLCSLLVTQRHPMKEL